MIPASALANIRAAANQTLTNTGTISRPTASSDGQGGETRTWATVATVPCRVAPALRQPEIGIIAARNQEAMGWTITFPALTDVRESDRITVGSNSYEVIGVLGPKTIETARRCLCVERDDA